MKIGRLRIGSIIFSGAMRQGDRCIGVSWALVSSSFSWLPAPLISTGSKWNSKRVTCYLRSSSSTDISKFFHLATHSLSDFLASSSIVILLIQSLWHINWLYRVGPSLEQDCCHLNSPVPLCHPTQGERYIYVSHCNLKTRRAVDSEN